MGESGESGESKNLQHNTTQDDQHRSTWDAAPGLVQGLAGFRCATSNWSAGTQPGMTGMGAAGHDKAAGRVFHH